MKKLRYIYIGLSIILTVGIQLPTSAAFALEPLTPATDDDATEIAEEKVGESGEEAEDEELDGEENSAKVAFLSYNPGFSDPVIGEFFELKRLSDTSISLAGLTVIYETSSGTEYTVLDFTDGYEMVGESLLLRLANSDIVKEAEKPEDVADLTYTRNMSQSAGRLKLKRGDEELDSLCWGLKEVGCYAAFNSKKPTTLVRAITEEELGEFEHHADYLPTFDPLKPGLEITAPVEEVPEPQCRNLEFSELFTYYETSSSEQFIELYNAGDEEANLEGCLLGYKGKNYGLGGVVPASSYTAVYPATEWGLTMTKNPTSSNKLTLTDVDGETVDSMAYYSGQKKGVSLALMGYNSDGSKNWKQTYSPTPGADNNYQQFKTCPVGKVINLETGNCVNDTSIATATTLAACPAGKYRNPLTGRCKSYATTASTELKPCAEGYERNPETNRCRKIVANTGAEYPIEAGAFEEKTELTAIWAIVTVVVAGLGYIAFQYKDELKLKFAHR